MTYWRASRERLESLMLALTGWIHSPKHTEMRQMCIDTLKSEIRKERQYIERCEYNRNGQHKYTRVQHVDVWYTEGDKR